jgi:hypothetical protein
LRLLVQRFGPRDWTNIAGHLYQRNGKQYVYFSAFGEGRREGGRGGWLCKSMTQ